MASKCSTERFDTFWKGVFLLEKRYVAEKFQREISPRESLLRIPNMYMVEGSEPPFPSCSGSKWDESQNGSCNKSKRCQKIDLRQFSSDPFET